jgi:hypothetical protein
MGGLTLDAVEDLVDVEPFGSHCIGNYILDRAERVVKRVRGEKRGIRMRNLTQVSVFHGFPFVKMKMRRFAPVRMGWHSFARGIVICDRETSRGKLENPSELPAFVAETLEQKFGQLLMVAEFCVQVRATTPALVLIYSAIDVAGWLYAANPSASPGQRFTSWVAKYLLPDANLDCSSRELYGARCGIVHNFSTESDLSRKGEVRQIVYSWGDGDIETLRAMTKIVNLDQDETPNILARSIKAKFTSVKLEILIAAFRKGLIRFFKEAESDERMAARMKERSGKVLMHMSKAEGETLVKWGSALLADADTGSEPK